MGYGLLDLNKQLLGGRALYIYLETQQKSHKHFINKHPLAKSKDHQNIINTKYYGYNGEKYNRPVYCKKSSIIKVYYKSFNIYAI